MLAVSDVCSQSEHEAMKVSEAAFLVFTEATSNGVRYRHGAVWGNCKICHSTLMLPVTHKKES